MIKHYERNEDFTYFGWLGGNDKESDKNEAGSTLMSSLLPYIGSVHFRYALKQYIHNWYII